MLAGAVLGPVGALAGAIGGALAGSRAGAAASEGTLVGERWDGSGSSQRLLLVDPIALALHNICHRWGGTPTCSSHVLHLRLELRHLRREGLRGGQLSPQ